MHISVSEKLKSVYVPHPVPIIMKQVVFQLAECGEQQNNMVAHWVQGFWVVDPELELDKHGQLYLKGE